MPTLQKSRHLYLKREREREREREIYHLCTLEWQIFCDTENTEKSQKLSTKQKTQKIAENSIFMTQLQKISMKIIVFRIIL